MTPPCLSRRALKSEHGYAGTQHDSYAPRSRRNDGDTGMSVKALTWAFDQVTRLPVDKLVLLALADYADHDGTCFPSQDALAKRAMCSVDTVQRSLSRLIVAGMMSKSRRYAATGHRTSDAYALNLHTTSSGLDRNLRHDPKPQSAAKPKPHLDAETKPQSCGVEDEPSLNRQEEKPPTPSRGPTPLEALSAFEDWNATASRCALAQAAKLTPDRQRKIIARLKDYGTDGWSRALANIEKSSFLTGKNDRGWRADLDFLIAPASFSKVHDGTYGNGRHAETFKPADLKPHEIELQREADELKRMGVI